MCTTTTQTTASPLMCGFYPHYQIVKTEEWHVGGGFLEGSTGQRGGSQVPSRERRCRRTRSAAAFQPDSVTALSFAFLTTTCTPVAAALAHCCLLFSHKSYSPYIALGYDLSWAVTSLT